MSSSIGAELSHYMKERIDKKVSFAEFFDASSLSVPENLESAKARIVVNYGNMFGNYAVVLGVVLTVFLVLHPLLIIPMAFSFGVLYLTIQREGESVQIFGGSWKKEHLYAIAIATPLIFFIAMPRTLGSLLISASLGVIVSISHMVVTKPKQAEEEV